MSDQPQNAGTTTGNAAAVKTEFATTILELDKGRVHDDGTDYLAQVVDAVCLTGKPGKVTLTITVEPQDRETFEDTGVLIVSGEVKPTIPRPTRGATIFYATGVGGGMTRQDPNVDSRWQ
jgi:hypothetical protein